MHKFVNHDLESTEADKMIVGCTLHVHGSGEEGSRRKILQLQLQPLAVTKGSRMVVKNFEQFWQLGFFFLSCTCSCSTSLLTITLVQFL